MSISAEPARLRWVDVGRGLAILLVVAFHAARWLSSLDIDTSAWQTVNATVSTLRMPLFFTLSGMFARSWVHKRSWKELARSKLALFVWVFLVWEVIGSAAMMLATGLQGSRLGFRDVAFGLVVSLLVPRLEVWFIWALALFFVVAKLTRPLPAWLQIGVAAVASTLALALWANENTGGTGALKYHLFFVAGLHLREWLLELADSMTVGLGILVFVMWAVTSTVVTVFDLRSVVGIYFLNCLIGVLAGVVLSRALDPCGLLASLGRQTLQIYLAHTPLIIVLLVPLWALRVPALMGDAPDVLITPIFAAASTTLAVLLYRALQPTPLRHLYTPPQPLVDLVIPRPPRRAVAPPTGVARRALTTHRRRAVSAPPGRAATARVGRWAAGRGR